MCVWGGGISNITGDFLAHVSQKDEMQGKYISGWEEEVTLVEKNALNIFLHFMTDECHYSMDFISDAYLFFCNMIKEETYYFIRNRKYRNSSYKEVNKLVYNNPEYMEKYMTGLSISDYIWVNHIKLLRYFEEKSYAFMGARYLEIGPGYGQYLVKVIAKGYFEEYHACDVSKTSVYGSNRFLKYLGIADKCEVIEKDFFEYDSNQKYDCIVAGEVLEHVEEPLLMLKKIYGLLENGGTAFITTAINAPALDHIFLFHNIEQILNLVKKAGFQVDDYMCSMENDISLEKAAKTKRTVNIALVLKAYE